MINQDSDQPFYYALNAILQLGLMAESEGDYEMAKKYYRQCLDMDKSQYRNSINYKAALGLERVGDYLNE